ncbi:hypothetical protein F383_31225 [Gossypium arboreum]|uniref:Uncharacterized protein n=1 Tax=Gossypium arboreum TaxID=29729 RepID=A0A0B0PMV6_GOSAR|nr:hypothetical protein F383_31225 [Gossypium arboreum]
MSTRACLWPQGLMLGTI